MSPLFKKTEQGIIPCSFPQILVVTGSLAGRRDVTFGSLLLPVQYPLI